jgi:hypothetical protein
MSDSDDEDPFIQFCNFSSDEELNQNILKMAEGSKSILENFAEQKNQFG